jgi:membrane associated rhomboid family serine protease
MSIYDREYMVDDDDSYYGDPSRRRNNAITVLIIINALVWIAWQFARSHGALQGIMNTHFTVGPAGVTRDFYLHTLLTSAISHEDLGHIFFNMLFLWFLGQDVERVYGRNNFFWLYACCGILASAAHVGLALARHSPTPALGASGAVMGIAVLAAIFDPDRPIHLFGVIPLKLKWLVALYIVMDLLGTVQTGDGISRGDGVAHAAHLGGALGGAIFWKFDLRVFGSPGRREVGLWHRLRGWFRRKPRLRLVEKSIPNAMPREAVVQRGPSQRKALGSGASAPQKSGTVDAETAIRVDQLLAKISAEGLDSLTGEERAFLNASSEKYKRR